MVFPPNISVFSFAGTKEKIEPRTRSKPFSHVCQTILKLKRKLITKYFLFYEEILSLNGIKTLINLSSLHLFHLLLKSHDYKVIINA